PMHAGCQPRSVGRGISDWPLSGAGVGREVLRTGHRPADRCRSGGRGLPRAEGSNGPACVSRVEALRAVGERRGVSPTWLHTTKHVARQNTSASRPDARQDLSSQRPLDPTYRAARNSRTAAAKASGFSRLLRWPAPGTVTSFALGIFAASAWAIAGGVIAPGSPMRNSAGTAVRSRAAVA